MMLEQPDSRGHRPGLYRLYQAYRYEWSHRGRRYAITIPEGFIYDGASVPRIAWTFTGITRDGLLRAAALVHDWLYRHCGRLPEGSFVRIVNGTEQPITNRWSRHDADRMFGRLMREAGESVTRRRAAYLAVRLFGWIPWVRGLWRIYRSEIKEHYL